MAKAKTKDPVVEALKETLAAIKKSKTDRAATNTAESGVAKAKEKTKAKDLTAGSLKNQKPAAKRREIPDGHTRGLFHIIQPSGVRSWAYRYRVAGMSRKLTLGAFPQIDLSTARALAREAATAIARGDDPAALKKTRKAEAREAARKAAARESDRVEDVVQAFITKYAKPKNRSWRETERLLTKELKPWRGRRLGSIKPNEVEKLLAKIVERGAPISANRFFAAFRTMCRWAAKSKIDIIDQSPCDKLDAPVEEEVSRTRILSDVEIKILWAAFEEIAYPFGSVAQMLLLTGARLREIGELRWSEVDLAAKTLTIPEERSKNKTAHIISLSDAALQILQDAPRIGSGKYVFTISGAAPIKGFQPAKARIDKLTHDALRALAVERHADDPEKAAHWVYHDLRRTFASGLAALEVEPHVIEATLNHTGGIIKGVAKTYNRYSYLKEKRKACDAWARHVEHVVTGRSGEVIDFATVRR